MFEIRPIQQSDNAALAKIIRTVMPEFGACGAGFSIEDAEVDDMYAAYSAPRASYYVVVQEGRVVGGAGIARLDGATEEICELKKMYFLKEARGLGAGQKLIELCLQSAARAGFKLCYLETLKSMSKAKALYERNGFKALSGPLGSTGHFGCDSWYSKQL